MLTSRRGHLRTCALAGLPLVAVLATGAAASVVSTAQFVDAWRRAYTPATKTAENPGGEVIAEAARGQVGVTVSYDPAYVGLSYPGGDVALETGVCSDVVIRALRAAGVDLQQRVHEDMRAHFAAYPRMWRARAPDRNIDHRRVANLMVYLRRHGTLLPIDDLKSYTAGDIVAWLLPSELLHIGVVVNERHEDSTRPLVVHNIGAGAQAEDALFTWPVLGHFRLTVKGRAASGDRSPPAARK